MGRMKAASLATQVKEELLTGIKTPSLVSTSPSSRNWPRPKHPHLWKAMIVAWNQRFPHRPLTGVTCTESCEGDTLTVTASAAAEGYGIAHGKGRRRDVAVRLPLAM